MTAGRAGISPQYLSEVERGRKEPSSEMIAALAGALGVTLTELTEQLAGELRRQQGIVTELRRRQGTATGLSPEQGAATGLRRRGGTSGVRRRQRAVTELRGQQGTSRGAGQVTLSLAA